MLGLEFILYSVSIMDFLSLWPINYDPWSYVISIILEYLDSHVVSTNFSIDIDILSLYCAISNHPVTGLIIAMNFRCRLMTWAPMRYTQSLFHGIYSDSLAGNLPYFLFDCFLHCQVSQLIPSFRTESLMSGQYKYWQIIAYILHIHVWRRYLWYQCNT